MPRYDYHCPDCEVELEKDARIDDRHKQVCDCGSALTLIHKPQRHYVPFNGYFDVGLGVEVTGRHQRQQAMAKLSVDFRDPPKKGDISVRLDKIAERKRADRQSR